MTAKLPWTLQGQMHPIYVTSIHESQIFSPFRSTSSFRDTSHFETSALNDPKMTLNTTRWNVPYICVTNVSESQISPHFPLWRTVFDTQLSIIDNVPNGIRMTLNTYQSKVPYIYYIPTSEVQFSVHSAAFKIQGSWKAAKLEIQWMTSDWS